MFLICIIERYYYAQSVIITSLMLAESIITMFSGISVIVSSLQGGICVEACLYAFYASLGLIIIGIIAYIVNVHRHNNLSKFKDKFCISGSNIVEFKKLPMSFALFEVYWVLCSAREKFHLWLWELPPRYCTPQPNYHDLFPNELSPVFDNSVTDSSLISLQSLI